LNWPQFEFNSTVFIVDDRDRFEKAFFGYLAAALPYTDKLLGSVIFYGLDNRTSASYAFYR
jgi:hypothetical protein